MGIVITIMGGLVLISVFASGFDFLSKRRNHIDDETKKKVEQIEQKIIDLENTIQNRDERILQLENDLSFMNKLLENK